MGCLYASWDASLRPVVLCSSSGDAPGICRRQGRCGWVGVSRILVEEEAVRGVGNAACRWQAVRRGHETDGHGDAVVRNSQGAPAMPASALYMSTELNH